MLAEMFDAYGKELKAEIGHGMAPVANMILASEADRAVQTAPYQDQTGALHIAEVQAAVRQNVQGLIAEGRQVTPEVVENLAGIHLMQHIKKVGGMQNIQYTNGQPQQQQQQVTRMSTGGAPVFGGFNNPSLPTQPNPNAPRTSLDPATETAMKAVTSFWKPNMKLK